MRIKTIVTQKNEGQLHALTKKGAVCHLSAFIEFWQESVPVEDIHAEGQILFSRKDRTIKHDRSKQSC